MPVFALSKRPLFPDPGLADPDGLLAVGGDLSEKRLLAAYSMGIFPWYMEGSPILWWSPDPRLVLMPSELRVSRSLRQTLKRGTYRVTADRCFDRVIVKCATTQGRSAQGTWITGEMRDAYRRLHDSGFCHSVETWCGDELAGGLYGVAIGGAFFGESMFSERSDASKVALVRLVEHLAAWGFRLVDCQVTTEHLLRLGARMVARPLFLAALKEAVCIPTRRGRWSFDA
jgi:leucyl/phenylalanyl-tRNA--protein transferase